jgi:hypothetical protein
MGKQFDATTTQPNITERRQPAERPTPPRFRQSLTLGALTFAVGAAIIASVELPLSAFGLPLICSVSVAWITYAVSLIGMDLVKLAIEWSERKTGHDIDNDGVVSKPGTIVIDGNAAHDAREMTEAQRWRANALKLVEIVYDLHTGDPHRPHGQKETRNYKTSFMPYPVSDWDTFHADVGERLRGVGLTVPCSGTWALADGITPARVKRVVRDW